MSVTSLSIDALAEKSWFAAQVRPGRELSVHDSLVSKGYEVFSPRYKTRRKWSDRVKEVDVPFFPGYVFCRVGATSYAKVVTTYGVIRIVSFCGRPTPIPDSDIESVRKLAECAQMARPWPYSRVGQEVVVKSGPLRGMVGNVVAVKNKYRIIVSIHLLQRSIAAEIDSEFLELEA